LAGGSLSRVLVTGGAGFVGRRVVSALLGEGHEVTLADKHASADGRAHSLVGDLCDPAVIAKAVSPGTDVIIHLAAVTSVLRSAEDPVGTYRLNVEATAGLLEHARQRGVGAFLLASTNAVAGDVGHATIDERTPLSPLTPYGASKAAGEMLLAGYAASYGITGPRCGFSSVWSWQPDQGRPHNQADARGQGRQGVQIHGDVRSFTTSSATRSRSSFRKYVAGRAAWVRLLRRPWRRCAFRRGNHHAEHVCSPGSPGSEGRREIAGLRAPLRPQGRHRHCVARILGDSQVTSRQSRAAGSEVIDHQAIDAAAVEAFATQYGVRATALPPLAVVIAAYNEEGAIGPVIEALPAAISGLDVAKIVVSDGSADGTVKEADEAGALVCDVPVNRGQGAALRLGYRLAREGGAQYIVTTDADGQYNPADTRPAARGWPAGRTSCLARATRAARRPRTRCARWESGSSPSRSAR
jgi:hypothetical protein